MLLILQPPALIITNTCPLKVSLNVHTACQRLNDYSKNLDTAWSFDPTSHNPAPLKNGPGDQRNTQTGVTCGARPLH